MGYNPTMEKAQLTLYSSSLGYSVCVAHCFQAAAFSGRMNSGIIYEDTFKVELLNPEGKKFDKVCRVQAESYDMFMQLDVNTEIYPINVGETYAVVLATTLNKDGTADTGYYSQSGRKSLADDYEYVMHGKLYKISEEGKAPNVKTEVYLSFGGLLMLLRGKPLNFQQFELDQRLFLLMRKV